MLEANKKHWFEKIFSIYNQNLLKRRFHSFSVFGLQKLIDKADNIPTIIYCNHSSWWDGLVLHHLAQKTNLDFFVMMEEKQLKDLQLFRKLGAFSVVRENPRSGVISIKYAANLLIEDSKRTLCIFPQGEILPNNIRPIKFYNGLARIIEKVGNSNIFSVAIVYEFLGNFKPEIFVSVGTEFNPKSLETKNTNNLTNSLVINLTENFDGLKKKIVNNDLAEFTNII